MAGGTELAIEFRHQNVDRPFADFFKMLLDCSQAEHGGHADVVIPRNRQLSRHGDSLSQTFTHLLRPHGIGCPANYGRQNQALTFF